MMVRLAALFFILLFGTQTFAASAYLEKVRLSHQKNKTRVVFDVTKKVNTQIFIVERNKKLVIDVGLHDTRNQARFKALNFKPTVLKNIRIGRQEKTGLRVVMDLKQAVLHKSFWLAPKGKYKYYRLVLDLTPKKKPTQLVATIKKKAALGVKPELRTLYVMIDPGHGGKDPGATGAGGLHEKTVVLSIARYLEADLNQIPGVKAYLTRKGNYYVGLRQRLWKARKIPVDLFVSVHADAFTNNRAQGASVFALSQRGATSEGARWLARSANKSLALYGDIKLSDKDPLLSSVLLDMSQTATINDSLQLGQDLLHWIGKIAKLHSKRVGQAAFVVLKSPDIPSVLIETGFLSNREEEKLLAKPSYRLRMAQAISTGILAYFKHKMPRDTIFAAHFMTSTYIIKRGDTLGKIAAQHKVSVASLKALNKLKSNMIVPGKVLKIPKAWFDN